MRKNDVISVIVPIYNVEKYLEECIDSIIRQTYDKLEIILVDDGSRDSSGAICDRYAQTDNRIIVVHQKNGGAASAKNAGLRMATGAYIAFVDGDDYLEQDAYEVMVEAIKCHDADIVQGKFQYIYTNGTQIHNGSNETVCFTAAEYLLHFWADWTCAICPDKLFRHHVLDDVFFEEGHQIDDEFFTYRGVMNAGKVVYIPTVVYNYRQRASSVMKNRATTEKKCDDVFAYLDKRNVHVIGRFPELKSPYENYYADYLMTFATSDIASEKTVKAIKKRLIAHMAGGKVLFWKKGQRKRTWKILAFLMKPAGRILKHQKEETKDSGHEFFE